MSLLSGAGSRLRPVIGEIVHTVRSSRRDGIFWHAGCDPVALPSRPEQRLDAPGTTLATRLRRDLTLRLRVQRPPGP